MMCNAGRWYSCQYWLGLNTAVRIALHFLLLSAGQITSLMDDFSPYRKSQAEPPDTISAGQPVAIPGPLASVAEMMPGKKPTMPKSTISRSGATSAIAQESMGSGAYFNLPSREIWWFIADRHALLGGRLIHIQSTKEDARKINTPSVLGCKI